jgi:hypothetical protein
MNTPSSAMNERGGEMKGRSSAMNTPSPAMNDRRGHRLQFAYGRDTLRCLLELRVEEREERLPVALGRGGVVRRGVAQDPAVPGGVCLDLVVDARLGEGLFEPGLDT